MKKILSLALAVNLLLVYFYVEYSNKKLAVIHNNIVDLMVKADSLGFDPKDYAQKWETKFIGIELK